VDGEDCIAKGQCECGLVEYFLDYYGVTKAGISLKGLAQRVAELNEEAVAEFERTRIPIPPRGNRAMMRNYYSDNRARILAQVSKYGFNATSRRLRISRRTLYRIIKKTLLLTLQ
jgi:AraC-like DNA-binding protein